MNGDRGLEAEVYFNGRALVYCAVGFGVYPNRKKQNLKKEYELEKRFRL